MKLYGCDTAVRTKYVIFCHFARFTFDSDLSPHILYRTHSKFTLCLFTLVVNYTYYNHTSPSCLTLGVPAIPSAQPEGPRVTRRRSRLQPPSPATVCAPSLSKRRLPPSPLPATCFRQSITGKRHLQTFVTFLQKPQPRKIPAVGFCTVLCRHKTSKAVL